MFFVVCSEQETPPAQHHLELEGQPLPPSHQRRRVYRLLPPLPQVAMALAAQLHPSQRLQDWQQRLPLEHRLCPLSLQHLQHRQHLQVCRVYRAYRVSSPRPLGVVHKAYKLRHLQIRLDKDLGPVLLLRLVLPQGHPHLHLHRSQRQHHPSGLRVRRHLLSRLHLHILGME